MAQVSDLFTRADENPLSDDGKWVKNTQMGLTGTLQLVSNTARSVSPLPYFPAHYVRNDVNAGATQFSKVKVGYKSAGTGYVQAFICGPGSNATVNGYQLWNAGLAEFRIYRIDSNVGTQLAADFGTALATGDVLLLVLEGGVVKGYQNGNLIVSASDATYSGGYPAMLLYNGDTTPADITISEFYGGDGTDWTGGGASAVPLLMQHYN